MLFKHAVLVSRREKVERDKKRKKRKQNTRYFVKTYFPNLALWKIMERKISRKNLKKITVHIKN
jgi:hypothetical protein